MADIDVVEGKLKQAEGTVQDAAGQVTGSPEDRAAGTVKQVEGQVQEGLGHAKEAVKDALDKDQV